MIRKERRGLPWFGSICGSYNNKGEKQKDFLCFLRTD
jgi:hypothetical protein